MTSSGTCNSDKKPYRGRDVKICQDRSYGLDPSSGQAIISIIASALPDSTTFTIKSKVTDANRNKGSDSLEPIQGATWMPTEFQSAGTVNLTLNKYVSTTLEIDGPKRDLSPGNSPLWTSPIQIPIGDTYYLPIPRAAIFGSTTFKLGLSAFGGINSLEYGKNAAAPDVLDAAAAAAAGAAKLQPGAFSATLAEAQAAEYSSQADKLYQMQRLGTCLIKPGACVGK